MKFLYIFEDGTINQSDLPPTDDDLESINEGYLEVLQISGEKIVVERVLYDSIEPIQECQLRVDRELAYHERKPSEPS